MDRGEILKLELPHETRGKTKAGRRSVRWEGSPTRDNAGRRREDLCERTLSIHSRPRTLYGTLKGRGICHSAYLSLCNVKEPVS